MRGLKTAAVIYHWFLKTIKTVHLHSTVRPWTRHVSQLIGKESSPTGRTQLHVDETSVETLLWSCSLPGGQSAGQAALHQATPPSDVARQEAEAGPVLPTPTLRTGRWEGELLPVLRLVSIYEWEVSARHREQSNLTAMAAWGGDWGVWTNVPKKEVWLTLTCSVPVAASQ